MVSVGVTGHVAEADTRADSWDANMGVAENIPKFRPNRADNLDVNVDVDVECACAQGHESVSRGFEPQTGTWFLTWVA